MSDLEDVMGCSVKQAQVSQADLEQKSSLSQEQAVAQTLQVKDELLVDIIEEKKKHRTKVSILSQMHL